MHAVTPYLQTSVEYARRSEYYRVRRIGVPNSGKLRPDENLVGSQVFEDHGVDLSTCAGVQAVRSASSLTVFSARLCALHGNCRRPEATGGRSI